jgi:hypothetical protein
VKLPASFRSTAWEAGSDAESVAARANRTQAHPETVLVAATVCR